MSTQGKYKLLYVDDDLNNLISFKANFRREYKVFTTTKQVEAFDLIREEGIQIVLADYKMPKINGVLFLEQVRSIFPDTVRIMLTGHAGLDEVIDAINRGGVYRFFCKPWKEEELEQGIIDAIEIIKTRDALQSQTKKLRKAYSELDRLVYAAAHDITSPLSNILGLVQLSRDDSDHSEDYLNMIEQMSWRIQALSQNIINFHFNKREDLKFEEFNLKTLLKQVISELQILKSSFKIDIDIDIDVQAKLNTDRSRLYAILSNVISNSIRYQDRTKEEHWIRISGYVNKVKAKLSIQDNGVGVDKEDIPHIFDSYYRGESNRADGTGMGLYVVKETVEVLDGTLRLNSEKSKGTMLTIEIPNTSQPTVPKKESIEES